MAYVITISDDGIILLNGSGTIIINGVEFTPKEEIPEATDDVSGMENLLKIVKHFEGFYAKAYKCPADVWTIGWGTIRYANGQKVKEGDVITRSDAEKELKYELQKSIDYINKNIKTKLNENQLSALASFIYNCGPGALDSKWSIGKAVRNGDLKAVPNLLMAWVKGGGRPLKGLWIRRLSEAFLFQGFDPFIATQADPNWQNIRYYNDAFKKYIGSD